MIVQMIDVIMHDDMEEEVFETPITSQSPVPSTSRNATQIATQTTLVRSASGQFTPRVQPTSTSSSSSSTSPDPTLASLVPRKIRIMDDIYNVDTTNSFSLFAPFSQIDDPLTFEEFVKDGVWAQIMDEEIKCIENN